MQLSHVANDYSKQKKLVANPLRTASITELNPTLKISAYFAMIAMVLVATGTAEAVSTHDEAAPAAPVAAKETPEAKAERQAYKPPARTKPGDVIPKNVKIKGAYLKRLPIIEEDPITGERIFQGYKGEKAQNMGITDPRLVVMPTDSKNSKIDETIKHIPATKAAPAVQKFAPEQKPIYDYKCVEGGKCERVVVGHKKVPVQQKAQPQAEGVGVITREYHEETTETHETIVSEKSALTQGAPYAAALGNVAASALLPETNITNMAGAVAGAKAINIDVEKPHKPKPCPEGLGSKPTGLGAGAGI